MRSLPLCGIRREGCSLQADCWLGHHRMSPFSVSGGQEVFSEDREGRRLGFHHTFTNPSISSVLIECFSWVRRQGRFTRTGVTSSECPCFPPKDGIKKEALQKMSPRLQKAAHCEEDVRETALLGSRSAGRCLLSGSSLEDRPPGRPAEPQAHFPHSARDSSPQHLNASGKHPRILRQES